MKHEQSSASPHSWQARAEAAEREIAELIEALRWQASEHGCYCETDVPADEAGIPIKERCPYCLMGKACQLLEALASSPSPGTGQDGRPIVHAGELADE